MWRVKVFYDLRAIFLAGNDIPSSLYEIINVNPKVDFTENQREYFLTYASHKREAADECDFVFSVSFLEPSLCAVQAFLKEHGLFTDLIYDSRLIISEAADLIKALNDMRSRWQARNMSLPAGIRWKGINTGFLPLASSIVTDFILLKSKLSQVESDVGSLTRFAVWKKSFCEFSKSIDRSKASLKFHLDVAADQYAVISSEHRALASGIFPAASLNVRSQETVADAAAELATISAPVLQELDESASPIDLSLSAREALVAFAVFAFLAVILVAILLRSWPCNFMIVGAFLLTTWLICVPPVV